VTGGRGRSCLSAGLLSEGAGSVSRRVEPGRFGVGLVDVGDAVSGWYDGVPCSGRVDAVAAGRALVRLTVVAAEGWTSPITGGTVPAGCPRTYLLWLPAGRLTPGQLGTGHGYPQRDR